MTPARREQILQALWPQGADSKLGAWAILDCARDPRIYLALLESRLEFRCLYSGKLPRELEMVAPQLVELSPGNRLMACWLDEGWGQSWGVFLQIDDASNLRHHLRKFLKVRDEDGRRLLFRYYDPRVLRTYLPRCDAAERRRFFGPISGWLTEAEDGTGLIDHARTAPGRGVVPAAGAAAGPADASTLVIRREQWQAFEQQAAQRSALWLADELARLFPQAAGSGAQAQWLDRVRGGIARAGALGVSARGDLLRFLSLESEYGAGFLEQPAHAWMHAMLVDARVPQAGQRLRRLMQAIAARAARADEKATALAEYLSASDEETQGA